MSSIVQLQNYDSSSSLELILTCPICFEVLKNATAVKICLHRFCYNCIVSALRLGNKECPLCRKKVATKRSLRSDHNLDLIIMKIYPSCSDANQSSESTKNKKYSERQKNSTTRTSKSNAAEEFILRLKTHPSMTGDKVFYLKTTANGKNKITVRHLIKYLTKVFEPVRHSPRNDCRIYVPSRPSESLNVEHTLQDVCKQFKIACNRMDMFFFIK